MLAIVLEVRSIFLRSFVGRLWCRVMWLEVTYTCSNLCSSMVCLDFIVLYTSFIAYVVFCALAIRLCIYTDDEV